MQKAGDKMRYFGDENLMWADKNECCYPFTAVIPKSRSDFIDFWSKLNNLADTGKRSFCFSGTFSNFKNFLIQSSKCGNSTETF